MKGYEQFIDDLKQKMDILGFNPVDIIQGDENWKKLKLGIVSASNITKAIAKEGTATRQTYMCELISQICTGVFPEISAKPLEHGNTHEPAARSAFEFETGREIKELPFIFKDNDCRAGASPDGILDNFQGLEIKCPFNSAVHANFLCFNDIKKEYIAQCQFSMWVTGYDSWIFANYDPRFTKKMLHYITIEKDYKMMQKFGELVGLFLHDMDRALENIGVKFGSQWSMKND